jgi:septation ring formation regulator EzrA
MLGVLFYDGDSMNTQELIDKFSLLKNKHAELTAEKLRCEAKKEQLTSEIKTIQAKYPDRDLSTVESVEKTITSMTGELSQLLTSIEEQYAQIKAM